MNAANQRQLTPLLIVLVVVLGAVLLLLLAGIGRGAQWDEPRSLAPLPPAGNPANLPQPVPLQQFALVWQKPLFSPDRKPVARAADGGSNLGELELTGIILTPGLRMALLHDRNGDKQVRLREGEARPDGSVKLVELRPRSALFDSPAGRTELKLPAGAPIDAPKTGATAAPGRMPDQPMMAPPSTNAPEQRPAPDQATKSAVDRLRESIQKRRAARAAAANEGVR